MKKKKMTMPRSCADMPVSLRIVGARIPRTPRSTNDSHEQSAMPMHGTHMRQPGARFGAADGAATCVVGEDIGLLKMGARILPRCLQRLEEVPGRPPQKF